MLLPPDPHKEHENPLRIHRPLTDLSPLDTGRQAGALQPASFCQTTLFRVPLLARHFHFNRRVLDGVPRTQPRGKGYLINYARVLLRICNECERRGKRRLNTREQKCTFT